MSKKVLIAEDDLTCRHLIVNTVRRSGFSTIEASNGRLCWEILRDNPDVSLLITDMLMPEMSGRDLIRSIRGDSRFAQLPVIIISGIIKLSEIDDILKIGASRFLPKPVDLRELKEYLSKLTTPGHATTAGVETPTAEITT